MMTENKRFTYSNTYGWNGDGFRNVMNGLDEKNKELKERIKQQEELISEQSIQLDYLKDENKHMKDVLDENRQLKERINKLEIKLNWQKRKTTELQERNDRQYDRLNHLWECIRNKDWETLTKEWEEIEEADKKLQEESIIFM